MPERSDRLTRGLGVASALLGVPQVARPDAFDRAIGVRPGQRQRTTTRAIGVRELAAAGGLLAAPRPIWLWSRVLGDTMDLTLLIRALRSARGDEARRVALATGAAGVITAVDLYAAASRTGGGRSKRLTSTVTVNRPPADVYGMWRHLDRLPEFMAHLDEVRITGDRTSHWTATAPFGRTVEWDAETIDDIRNERIAWRSTKRARVPNSGEVRFAPAPGGRGTEVHVSLVYAVPAGRLGRAVARYFGEEPAQQLDDDLRRFKQVMETGEIVRSDGAPAGKRARGEFPQHPAQPLTDDELKEALS